MVNPHSLLIKADYVQEYTKKVISNPSWNVRSLKRKAPTTRSNVTINRELKVEVFRHFPRTANVKKSRDQGLAVRFAV